MITLTKNEKLLFLELERKNLIGDIKFLIKKLMGRYSFLDENKIFKDYHSGQRCIIVGAGPSINNIDLKKLKRETILWSIDYLCIRIMRA